MTTFNAVGFFLLGGAMIFLPALLPAHFMPNAIDGSNTSALWLAVMGLFQGSMGIAFIVRNEAAPFAIRLMTLRLPSFKPAERMASGLLLRPLRDGYMGNQTDDRQRLAA